jgi:hypothetical protein
MKLKLYLDFDGVILDTINVTYRQLKKLKITDEDKIQQFYKDIDWNKLIKETDQINDSISNIKKIIDSGLYDVEILTHVNSHLEGQIKTDYINSNLSGINVIPVFKHIDKCDAVDPYNAILVDDFTSNLIKWNDKGGISIKFSDNNKKCEFFTIDNLSKVIDMYDDIVNNIKKKQVVTIE